MHIGMHFKPVESKLTSSIYTPHLRMELRRRHSSGATATSSASASIRSASTSCHRRSRILASDALPLPIRHTNRLFSALFVASLVFLMRRWRQKIRSSSPLHILAFSEILAIFGLMASLIYLFSFFGITFIQSIISSHEEEEEVNFDSERKPTSCSLIDNPKSVTETLPESDEEVVDLVMSGKMPSYMLESKLGDCDRAVRIRNEALRRITGRGLEGLPVDGFDYNSILGQCCEMPIGYIQLPVGVAGPLALDGREYYLPMATTEGCLVASTNRGCKAIAESGGAQSVVLKDGMSRAPAVRFPSALRAAELKAYAENPANFETISLVFNR